MDNLWNFSQRLSELLFDNKLTWKEFAIAIGVSRTTAYRWKLKPLQINLTNLLKVANYFKCTIEFLIGRCDNDRIVSKSESPKFSENLRKLMKEKDISTYQLRKISKYDGKYFEVWDSGSAPLLTTLIELSKIFNCSIDYLVGRDD